MCTQKYICALNKCRLCTGKNICALHIWATVHVCSREIILSWDVIYKQKFQKIIVEKNVCASAFNNYHTTIIHLNNSLHIFRFIFLLTFNGLAINPNFGSTSSNQNSKFVPIKRTRKLKDKVTWAKRLFCSNHK